MKQDKLPTKEINELVLQYKSSTKNRPEILGKIVELLYPQIEHLANIIAKKMHHIVSSREFVSCGADNLAVCIEAFDPTHKASFITFANNHIYKRLMRGCLKAAGITAGQQACFLKYTKAFKTLSSSLGRQPTDQELAEEIGCTIKRLFEMRESISRQSRTYSVTEEWGWGVEGMPKTHLVYKDMEFRNLLRLMDEHLTEDQKTVLILNHGHGLGEGPIREITKLPLTAIRRHKETALKIMRRVLQKDIIIEARLK